MNASRRSSSRRVSAASTRRYRTRPMVETLELRQLIASVDWMSKSSGDWTTASNWRTDFGANTTTAGHGLSRNRRAAREQRADWIL